MALTTLTIDPCDLLILAGWACHDVVPPHIRALADAGQEPPPPAKRNRVAEHMAAALRASMRGEKPGGRARRTCSVREEK